VKRDSTALDQLLRDGQVRRAPALSPAAPLALPTGIAALDAALGGGLARGQLHEFVGPPGAGCTALLRAALASATAAGEICALIDPGDSFDPGQRGIDLSRLLWVRPRDPVQALRAAEIALEARFALVALDLGGEKKLAQGAAPWARLARRAEKHGGALLVLSRAPQAGTFASAVVELERGRAQWEGRAGAPGRFLRGTRSIGAVARHKRMPPSAPLSFTLPLQPK
jgi:protein ImuA